MLSFGGGYLYKYGPGFSTLSQLRFESVLLTYTGGERACPCRSLTCQFETKGVSMKRRTALSVQISLTAAAVNDSFMQWRCI